MIREELIGVYATGDYKEEYHS